MDDKLICVEVAGDMSYVRSSEGKKTWAGMDDGSRKSERCMSSGWEVSRSCARDLWIPLIATT